MLNDDSVSTTASSPAKTRIEAPCISTWRKPRTPEAHAWEADASRLSAPPSTFRTSTAEPVTRTYRKLLESE